MENDSEFVRSITIGNVTIDLREPDVIDAFWIGQKEVYRFLCAAWLKMNDSDRIMSPLLVGPPGCGKTTLACSVAQDFNRPIYLINCTSDMRPEDLLITPVLSSEQKVVYRASSLVSAMVNGGICILDEANRMTEKSWASLASLLDDRRYIESIIAGVKISAHPEFRIVATMNDDSSTFNLPEYIESRLKPILEVEFPREEELLEIIRHHLPSVPEDMVNAVVIYLKEKKESRSIDDFSIRDAIQITRYAQKFSPEDQMTIDSIARRVIKVRDTGHQNFRVQLAF
jgi:MoxR-like ATPase